MEHPELIVLKKVMTILESNLLEIQKHTKYSYQGKAKSNHVENMKTLARRGSGLNAYINKYVKLLND